MTFPSNQKAGDVRLSINPGLWRLATDSLQSLFQLFSQFKAKLFGCPLVEVRFLQLSPDPPLSMIVRSLTNSKILV
jgi:hypothetical protein